MTYSFRAGDVVHEDLPYAVAVNLENISYVCSHCFKSDAAFACGNCQKLVYCDETCQEKDAEEHRVECGVLAGIQEELPDEEIRLVIRAIDRYIREKDCPTVGHYFGNPRSMDDLLSHVEDLNRAELEEVDIRTTEILNLLKGHLDVDHEVAREILMKCRINRYCLIDHNEPTFSNRGQVVYLAASAIDHTCVVNETYTYLFDGRRIIIRALNDFAFDDPFSLRIHYLSSQLPYTQRRSMTLDTYYFVCSCEKCVRQAREPETNTELTALAEEASSEIDALYQSSLATPEWYNEGVKILEKYQDQLVDDFAVFWLLTQLQNLALEQGFLEESVQYGAHALRSANTVLSMEPILFNLCLSMAMLGWNQIGHKAHRMFTRGSKLASKLFAVSHGPDHPIMRKLESFVDRTYEHVAA